MKFFKQSTLYLLFLIFIFATHSLHATIINVPGDESNIQNGIDAANLGDTVLIAPGTYMESGISISGDQIVLASWAATTGDMSYVAQTIIDGAQGGGSYANNILSISSSADHGSTIYGLTFKHGINGLHPFKKINLLHCIIDECDDGIDFEDGSGGTWEYNTVTNCIDDGFDLDNEILDVVCRYNRFEGHGEDGIEIRLDPTSTQTLIFSHNEFIGNGENGVQLIEEVGTTPRTFYFENNVFCNNGWMGLSCKSNGSSVENGEGYGIGETVYMLNNTFDGNKYGIAGGDEMLVLNSIFVNQTEAGTKNVSGNSIIDYSNFFGNNSITTNSNVGSNLLFTNPLLNADKTLMNLSPCIDAGVNSYTWNSNNVNNIPTSGFNGTAPDMGAYESTFACTDPVFTATTTCVGGNTSQFFIDVTLTSGSGSSYTISTNIINGSTWSITVGNTTQIGPFSNSTTVNVTLTDDDNSTCAITQGGYIDTCGGGCAGPIISTSTVCQSSNGANFYVDVTVSAGGGESYIVSNSLNASTSSVMLSGTVQVGPFPNNTSVNITVSDNSNACTTTNNNLVDDCPCTNPTMTATAVCNSGIINDFYIDVTINTGSGSSYLITNSINGSASVASIGSPIQIGPFTNNTSVNVTATDNDNGTCSVTELGVSLDCNTITINIPINSNDDDAEEDAGTVNLSGGDLDLKNNELVGLRFNNVTIPPGAVILNAKIQFTADKTSGSAQPTITINAEDIGNAPIFTTSSNNISDRTTTSAEETWSPNEWTTVGEAGADQLTPDLKDLVQEVVDRGDWASGNSIVFIFDTSGEKREAKSYDDGGGDPEIEIEYTVIIPLPVELSDFKIVQKNCKPMLEWKTASERDNDFFEIQRSMDGVSFNSIGRVEGNGDSQVSNYYSFMDEKTESDLYYYRLVQMDFNGSSSFSNTIVWKKECISEKTQLEVFPNPTTGKIHLETLLEENGNANFVVYDHFGKVLLRVPIGEESVNGAFHQQIDLSVFPDGLYFVALEIGGQKQKVEKVLLAR